MSSTSSTAKGRDEYAEVIKKQRTAAPLWVALAATTVAGGLEPLLTYPLEFVKTSQQLHNAGRKPHMSKPSPSIVSHTESTARSVLQAIQESGQQVARRTSILGVARNVWKQEGARGFYHGVGIVSAGGMAKATVRMSVYDRLKNVLQTPDGQLSGKRSLVAGLGAGLAETLLVVVPTETIKTKIVQATELPKDHRFYRAASSGTMTAVRTLHEIGGARVMYAGLSATLARQLTSAMVRFGTYSTLKNIVGGSMRPGQKLPSGITFGLGALSGMTTVLVTMPFDVAKTRMQSIGARTRYRSTWWCLVQTVQEEGLRALWRGSTMRLCRLTFSGAITFGVYEELTSMAGYA